MSSAIDIGTLIERSPEIRNGRPCIAGTGVTVRRIAGWLKPVRLCRFGRHELQRVEKIVEANETSLLENDFFKRRSAGSNGFGQ